jgi:hypothetical protein
VTAKASVTLLRGATARQRYYGVVSSKTAVCRKGRTVVLKRKGARRALATATTDRRGRYAFKRRGFVSGRIQITVKQARKGRVLCRGTSSPVILG